MKKRVFLLILITPFIFLSYNSLCQCDINSGCAGNPILTIDPPTFDAATLSIVLDNIEVGELSCTSANYQSGVAVYIYQLLPNGNRMELCNVLNAAPFNVVGSIGISFGPTSFCDGNSVNLGTVNVGPDQGFIPCDGAFLELEAVLFITENLGFDPALSSVYTELNTNEFISVDLGTLALNINNEFPGNGTPLTTASITDLNGGEGPITVNCGEDVLLSVEGLSRLANCPDYDDISTGIASELSNEFYYTINGGAPVVLQNAATGAAGGQLTGPDPALNNNCYAGILGNFALLWSILPPDLCDGSVVVVTITTTDIFSGQTLSDDITIIYTGGACGAPCGGIPGCTDPCDPNYDAAATLNDPALCAGYDDTCNADCTMGPFGGTWDATTCSCINETTAVNGCMDVTACNFDAAANCDDNSCQSAPICNTDPCNGDIEIIDPNDACTCIVDVPQVLGCTDIAYCEYDPAANCNDNTCVTLNQDPGCDDGDCANGLETWDTAICSCVTTPPTGINGCTDPAFCEYDPNATCDDGSCNTLNTDPGTCDNGDCTDGLETWDTATCSCITTPPTGVNGCTNATFCEYDPAATCDDGSCTNSLPTAGVITGGPYEFCVGDGTPDIINNITLTGGTGTNSSWIITDDQLNILDLPLIPGLVDFDNAPLGICLVWYITYEDITGLQVGMNANNLSGCYALSNSLEVVREDCPEPCTATAATIAGGPFSFCVGDGTPDFVTGITVTGGTGTNTAWVITDDLLNILGLPGMPGQVDFDGAGFGTCLIWYVTFDDITGAEVGMNAADLGGCFALSNSIEVVRTDCGPCEEEINGAIVVSDPTCDVSGIGITILAPDGTSIMVTTGADGTFSVPGGPFPCGDYTAAFTDPSILPECYTATGSADPIAFTIDGEGGGDDGPFFFSNPMVPTLSQWGLITLALLLMCAGSLSLFQKRRESLI